MLALQAEQIEALQRELAAALAGSTAANGTGACNGGAVNSSSPAAAAAGGGGGPLRGGILNLDMIDAAAVAGPPTPVQHANGNAAAAAGAAAGWPAAAHAAGPAAVNGAGMATGRGVHMPRVGKGAGAAKQYHNWHKRGRGGRGRGRGAAGDAS
jgi:hypothetical protein